MFVFLTVTFLIFNSGYQMQKKYEHCRDEQFKTSFCSLEKRISKYDVKVNPDVKR